MFDTVTIGTVLGGRTGRVDYSPSQAMAMVGRHSLVANCIGQWVKSYPSAPLVQRAKDGSAVYDDRLSLVLTSGLGLGEYDLKRLSMTFRLLTGAAALVALRNDRGLVSGLGLTHRHAMRLIKSTQGHFWEVRTGSGATATYDVADVLVLPWLVPDPQSPIFGVSPMALAYVGATSHEEAGLFVRKFLRNSAIPGAIVSTSESFGDTEEAKRATEEAFERKFTGDNNFKTAFIEGDIKIQHLGHGLKDINIDAVVMASEVDVCAAFMVPPALIDTLIGLKSGKYDTDATAYKKFVQGTVASLWQSDEQAISEWLVKLGVLLPGESVSFDTSNVRAMQEDEDKRASRIAMLYTQGVITREVAQSELGYEDLVGTYIYDAMRHDQAVQKRVKAYGDDSEQERESYAMWKSLDDYIDPLRSALERSLAMAFDELAGELHQTKGLRRKRATLDDLTTEEIKRRLLFASAEAREELVSALIQRAVTDSKFGDVPDSWLTEARRKAAEESASAITFSSETIAEEVREIIRANPTATAVELLDKLGGHIADIGASKAATIATTTATATNSESQNQVWRAINARRTDGRMIKPKWMSQRDGNVRDSHRAADGQLQDDEGYYTVGSDRMRGPGQGGSAKETANCRCVQVPVITRIDQDE